MPETRGAADSPAVPFPTALEQFPTLRQSRLAAFSFCALEAKMDEEWRRDWGSHPAAEGQIFHRFAAKALKLMEHAQQNTIDPEDGLDILRECLRQHDVPHEDVVNLHPKSIKRLRWVVVKWCHENVFDIEALIDVELALKAEVEYPNPNGGMVKRLITGTVDAFFVPQRDWAIIPDWKNTWNIPPANEISEEGYIQQRIYGYLAFVCFPMLKRVTLRETYVRLKDDDTGGAPVREATVFRNEMPELREEITALAEGFDRAVEYGTWPLVPGEMPVLWTPTPGSHCGYCPGAKMCPIFPQAREEGSILSDEDAERWAAEAVVAKRVVDHRGKALKAWAAVRGPVKIRNAKDPNRVMGYKQGKRTSRPKQEEVEMALREQGADLDVKTLYKTDVNTRWGQYSRDEMPGGEGAPDNAIDAELQTALEESVARVEGE